MTMWERISGVAGALGLGGGLVDEVAHTLGIAHGRDGPAGDVAFTIAVIALGAKMASADGVVLPVEIEAFRQVFRFDDAEAAHVARVFDLARQDTAGYQAYADQIARILKGDHRLLRHVLDGLFHIASADRILHPAEDAFLADVARHFGLTDSEFRFVRAHFVTDRSSPYDVLGLTPDASDAELHARHRRLVRENHPDVLAGAGLPPEFVEVANRKLVAINAAWAQLRLERHL